MVDMFKKAPIQYDTNQFSMPRSLNIIKECAHENIDWKGLHYFDLLSIIYSIRIDHLKQWLKEQQQSRMQKAGIASIQSAKASDFDSL